MIQENEIPQIVPSKIVAEMHDVTEEIMRYR